MVMMGSCERHAESLAVTSSSSLLPERCNGGASAMDNQAVDSGKLSCT